MDEKVLDKYIKGEATLEERQQVVDWMDADEKNVREVMALHKLHDIAVMNQIELPRMGKVSESSGRRHTVWRKVGMEFLKIAAVIAVLLVIQVSMKREDVGYQALYVPSGQRAELTLPDGTQVWLNSRTRLVYPQTFGDVREVKLNGEAYFSVARNEKLPFVVKAEGVDIKVLGTEFNVKAYSISNERQIDLLKGSVELSGELIGSKGRLMKPRERIHIVEGKIEQSRIDDDDYFKWKEGLICFNSESVGSIIKKLEMYYDISIIVDKDNFLNETYSGKFRTKDGIEQVLKVLQLEHDFTYVKDSNLNSITIK